MKNLLFITLIILISLTFLSLQTSIAQGGEWSDPKEFILPLVYGNVLGMDAVVDINGVIHVAYVSWYYELGETHDALAYFNETLPSPIILKEVTGDYLADPSIKIDSSGNLNIMCRIYYEETKKRTIWQISKPLNGSSPPNLPVLAIIDFIPNSLNLNNNAKLINCFIELTGEYDANDIDQTQDITLEYNGNFVIAEGHPREIGDYDSDGILDLMVKFDRTQLLLSFGIDSPGAYELKVKGFLLDGSPFAGTYNINVVEH